MDFYPKQTFHIYNQGNNKRQLFFSHENYQFFIWRMRAYLLPYGELIAYCLMPNHFHWLFHVHTVAITREQHRIHVDSIEFLRRRRKYGRKATHPRREHSRKDIDQKLITLNESIGKLEQSYSGSINKEKGWSGSLFHKSCKAKDGFIDEFFTVNDSVPFPDTRFLVGTDYKYRCFKYIHNNPVEANLVARPEDWWFSSAPDYAGRRNGTLCNLAIGRAMSEFV